MKKIAIVMMAAALCGPLQGVAQMVDGKPADKSTDHTRPVVAPPAKPADADAQMKLIQSQMQTLQAQGMLLEKTLSGLTEFNQWIQVQKQMQQLQAEYQRLSAPPVKADDKPKPAETK